MSKLNSKFISRYVKELHRYTKEDIKLLFELQDDEIDKFIRDLMSFDILRKVKRTSDQFKRSDLLDDEIEVGDDISNERNLFVFKYVGIITYGRRTIKIYPKYLPMMIKPLEEMKQIIQVLEVYKNSMSQRVNAYSGDENEEMINILSLIIFFFDDYYECGLYENYEQVIEINGEGDTDWDRTVDMFTPMIKQGRPYYDNYYTIQKRYDDSDFIRNLHMSILRKCSEIVQNAELEELFGITPIDYFENVIIDLDDREYLAGKIDNELLIQFNSRKQALLNAMKAFITLNVGSENEDIGFSMFGTSAFNMVWQAACEVAFGDKKKLSLKSLFPTRSSSVYSKEEKLGKVIEYPHWGLISDPVDARKTLEPDILIIDSSIGNDRLVILDAKYYTLYINHSKKELSGNPGVEDITKQYLYQRAYDEFISEYKIGDVENCFVFPTCENVTSAIRMGHAQLRFMDSLGLKPIKNRMVPANIVFDAYIKNKSLPLDVLDL